MTQHTMALLSPLLSVGGRMQPDTMLCHSKGFLEGFWQQRDFIVPAEESCSPHFSLYCTATSAWGTEANNRCCILACLLFVLFTLRIASWLAPKAVIQLRSQPRWWQQTKQAASAGFTQVLCYLAFLNSTLILLVCDCLFTRQLPLSIFISPSKITLY